MRFSRALAAIAVEVFLLAVVEYFDDFTQVESVGLEDSAHKTLERLFGLLGWRVAEQEEKRLGFSPIFVSLGIRFNLSEIREGVVVLENKEGRVEKLLDKITQCLKREPIKVGAKEALSINGIAA